MPALSEAALERQCSDFLALDGWRTLKTDPVSRREWGKGFGEKGMADRLYIRYQTRFLQPQSGRGKLLMRAEVLVPSEVIWIEWKRPGANARPHQQAWITAERARGALVLVAGEDFPADFDSFTAWYRQSRLMRRTI